jgi:hypothetical protein
MAVAPGATGGAHPPIRLPPQLAVILRPELPELIQEVIAEVRNSVPEYATVLDGPYAAAVPLIVEQALSTFVERVYDPTFSTEQRDKACRLFGRFEAYERRQLDAVEATFRIGARLALRRMRLVAHANGYSPILMLDFADAVLAYVEELVDVTRQGYAEAKKEMEHENTDRRQLLNLILSGPAASRAKLLDLAERADWPLPEEVTFVAYSPDHKPDRGAIADDTLLNLDDPQPYGLIPGAVDAQRRAFMRAAPPHVRLAVGLTVPIADAARSLHWARCALALTESGALPDRPAVFADEHLGELYLCAQPTLTDHFVRAQLTQLEGLTPAQRERTIDTLRAWLATDGNAVRMAERLHVHPQTARYRIRALEKTFGDRLTDPEARFILEVVVRALALRTGIGGAAAAGGTGPGPGAEPPAPGTDPEP